jgi:hypothetical protein
MKTKLTSIQCTALLLLLSTLYPQLSTFAQGTAFTYQGRLTDGANPANGSYDLTFALFSVSSGAGQVSVTLTKGTTAVSNGLFAVTLDFGTNFPGADRWLEIGVRTNGGGAFTTLTPRQHLTATPYAIMASGASNLLGALPATQLSAGTAGINISGSAASVTGGFAGDVTGTQNATVASKVGGVTSANVAAGANAANAATDADTPDTIVKRDSSGNISAASLTLDNTLTLPATTVTIYSGSNTLLHTDGENNLAYGQGALYNLFNGEGNTAIGFQALLNASSTFDNTAVGSFALWLNTTGDGNTAVGANALWFNTTGIGNTAVGEAALGDNTNGYENTAVGSSALELNKDGAVNTATGNAALYSNTHGSDNTADGAYALYGNVNGNANTAIGYQALLSNTNGGDNTAVGDNALYQNLSGHDNTAVGSQALYSNTNGYHNTAVGYYALYNNTTASGNTAVGEYALYQNTNFYNTADGFLALYANQIGTNNIALGYKAGYNVTNGNNGIFIGNPGLPTEGNDIRIGVPGLQNQAYIAGIYGVIDNSGLAVYVEPDGRLATAPSSARFKEDIHSMDDASDVLLSLRPVTFRYRPELVPKGAMQFGLVAEEVGRVAPELVVRDGKNEITGVRYEAVNAMLLNEFLKQHRQVEEQNVELGNQNADLQELSRKIATQNSENEELKHRLEALEKIIRNQK